MSLSFANTWGFLALLGLPTVIAIHFLQRKNRRVPATTLFLLEQMRRESRTGSRFDRLRTSVPFWLQLLMVLLLTWLLVQPRWLKQDAVQRIAVVMDASASMQAFREPALHAADDVLGLLAGPLARAELTLLSTDPEAASLYHGTQPAELRQALHAWEPLLGVHDFTAALRVARGLVGPKGVVVLVTDHPLSAAPPFTIQVISIGAETPNVGWTGVTVEEKDGQWIWHALLKNHSRTAQERTWQVHAGGAVSPPKTLQLGPGESRTLSGPFPPEKIDQLTLRLQNDALTLDDELPLVRPQPKILAIQAETAALSELMQRYAHTRLAPKDADLLVGHVLPPKQHACVFLPKTESTAYLKGSIVAEPHPLVEGLNWQGLVVRESTPLPRVAQDRVLLWQGERPLIMLRQLPEDTLQLICQFDLENSNARKLPALAVLLHRFLESLRSDKIAPEAGNYDLRQRLRIAHIKDMPLLLQRDGETPREIPTAQARLLRAPAKPGAFTVKQGPTTLLTAAAHFADTREADLTQAKPFNDLDQAKAIQVETTHEADPNQRLWLVLLLALLLASWWFTLSKHEAKEVAIT